MKDFNLLCMGCMKMKPNTGTCPYCHFDLEQYQQENAQKGLHYLQPGSILNGRYMIGKILGEGGFGITYIGWNLNLDMPIAIKEYFPNGFVTRNANQTNSVTVLSGGGKGQFYLKQKDRFLDEAKTLGKLNDIDAIVSIKDCFAENGTAYIVMEYLDGEDFGSFLKKNGGKLPARQVFEMMEPIIKALALIHKNNHGLIHRDISPDNIRIMTDGKVKLMDFGAARETDDEKSLSVVLKPGYAPEEQYRTRGKQGPWTDVYGLCATMYRAIVGKKPIESLERIAEDNLKKPSELGIIMNPKQEEALMKGLAVLAKNRWQSMDELYKALYFKPIHSEKKKDGNSKSGSGNQGTQSGSQSNQSNPKSRHINKEQSQVQNQPGKREYTQKSEQIIKPKIEPKIESKIEPKIEPVARQNPRVGNGGTYNRDKQFARQNFKTALRVIIITVIVLAKLCFAISEDYGGSGKGEKDTQLIEQTGKTVAINPGYEIMYDDNTTEPSFFVGKYTELPEYELNLQVAKKLKAELEERGYQVILTRDSNDSSKIQSKEKRIEQAIEDGADILISLHAETKEFYDAIYGEDTKYYHAKTWSSGDEEDEFYEKSRKLAAYILAGYCIKTGLEFGEEGIWWRFTDGSDPLEFKNDRIPSMALIMGGMDDKYCDEYMADENNQEIMAEGITDGIDVYFEEYGE